MKQHLKEKKLLFRVRTRQDADAYAELYDLYVEKIYRFVYLKLSNREEAEDVTSDIFLRTWQYLIDLEQGKDVKNFSGFVYQMARNKIIDVYRARSRRKEDSLDIDIHIHIESKDNNFEKIEQKHDTEIILKLIKQLKQEYQEVLLLKYVEDMSNKEIASILGKTPTSVRVTIHRALKKLKEISIPNNNNKRSELYPYG